MKNLFDRSVLGNRSTVSERWHFAESREGPGERTEFRIPHLERDVSQGQAGFSQCVLRKILDDPVAEFAKIKVLFPQPPLETA
jgi:hypothetical protein